ncbi:MAG: hypothetical protein ACLS3M_04675 [Collinsella sp.]
MALLGLVFAVVVTLFFIAGATIGQTIASAIRLGCRPVVRCRRHDALRRLRRLLKLRVNRDMCASSSWAGLALITVANESLQPLSAHPSLSSASASLSGTSSSRPS